VGNLAVNQMFFHLYSTHDNISDSNSDHSQVLRIVCDAPMTTEQKTEKIKTSDAPQSSPQTAVSEKSTTHSSNIDTTTTVTTESKFIYINIFQSYFKRCHDRNHMEF
jgi:hypothetical protein